MLKIEEGFLLDFIVKTWSILGALTFVILFKVQAPYGKFSKEQRAWTLRINGKLGWFIQEIVSPISFLYFYHFPLTIHSELFNFTTVANDSSLLYQKHNSIQIVFVMLWILHYLHRAVIYTIASPRMNDTDLSVVAMAICFNLINGYINGASIGRLELGPESFDMVSVLGLSIMLAGALINLHSDYHLMALRRSKHAKKHDDNDGKQSSEHKKKYFIPTSGAFRWVSCANYFGEILEWTGMAICFRTPAIWSFSLWTFCNLAPRAVAAHQWYLQKFGSKYQKLDRKAIIPYIL